MSLEGPFMETRKTITYRSRVAGRSPALQTNISGGNEMKYGLLWLIGIPIPILIVAFLIFH
jgi:hypothetical protein